MSDALVRADRQVPALLDRPLAQPPLAHDRPDGAVGQQVAQHPQQVGARHQLRVARRGRAAPAASSRCCRFEAQRREPVVARRGPAAAARRSRPGRSGRRRAGSRTRRRTSRRPGTASFSMQVTAASWKSYGVGRARSRMPGQQDRRLEHRDGVGGAGQVAVAAGQPHDVDAPAEQFGLVERVQRGRLAQEAGQLVGRPAPAAARRRRGAASRRPSSRRALLARRAGTARRRLRVSAFAQVAAAIDTEPEARPNCASIAEWLDGIRPYSHVRGRARADLEGVRAVDAELLDPAGRVERAADVQAVRRVGAGRGQVLAHPGPHVALAVLVARAPGRASPGASRRNRLPIRTMTWR